jgi:hypothetical protein
MSHSTSVINACWCTGLKGIWKHNWPRPLASTGVAYNKALQRTSRQRATLEPEKAKRW